MALTRIRYRGLSDVRVMSKRDLASAGVGVESELKWDRTNRHTVVVENMSEVLEDLLKAEGTFTIEEIDAETGKTVQTIVKATKADDTGATVVDGTTGQKSTKGSGK